MRNLLILGAGTAGTMMCNHLAKKLAPSEWKITLVDQHPQHYYQPGFLFLPFGVYKESDVVRPKRDFLPRNIALIQEQCEKIDTSSNRVLLASGENISYDLLIIATGCKTAPEQTEGMLGADWRKKVFDFYTFEGAIALREALKNWSGGRLVIHINELPIKCPVAPLEFAFLMDWWLNKQGLRDKTELTYVTPLSGAFTKPICSEIFGDLLGTKGIKVIPDFATAKLDNDQHTLVSWDEKVVPYDLLVTIPTNMGDSLIERSGLGDEYRFIPTDKHTLLAKKHKNIFVIGDATDVPASKAGSVAHFEAEVLTKNVLHWIRNEPLEADFDGHANCFIETGFGKAFLIDFNYELEPVPGTFPLPLVGPLSLLKETRMNHFGKMMFKWIYWNLLLKARPLLGIGHRMSLKGKQIPETLTNTGNSK